MSFFFEASLIPIFKIILGWRYQPERLLAGIIICFTLYLYLSISRSICSVIENLQN